MTEVHSLMASASYDLTVRIWDVGSGRHVTTIPHSDSQINAMAFTPNGYQLAVAAFQKVRIYDMTSLKPPNHISPIVCFEQIMKNVTAIGFEAQSRWMFTGGEDHSCRVYEMRVNQLVCQRVFDNLDPVTSVVIHGNQVELFIADQAGQVYVWDLRRDGHMQLPMPPLSYQEFVTNLSIHPSANMLAGITNRGYLIVWDLSNGSDEWAQKQNFIERTTETVARLKLSDSGKHLIQKSYGLSCRYSPDGRTLVTTGADNTINVLESHDCSQKSSIDAGCDWNWNSAFTCDSRLLFTGGSDNRVKLWDVDSGQMVMKYDGHTKPITALCVSDVPLSNTVRETHYKQDMFARKAKASDLMGSLQRFTDMSRDSVSRVKHLKILLDQLSTHEKRQLIEEHNFETFHLVDELLLSADIIANPQGAVEGESGLWTLEQILCLAPELVGNGWQRHAIEALLKKALYPRNLLAIRKIAIRLFLIFYQSLSVYGKATEDLDRVFQCLLPYFPLKDGQNTEAVLQQYCHSADRSMGSPTTPGAPVSNAKERAQMLQVYLDKFLEYCTRETSRIEWNDEKKRFQCANFIIDRVINLYIAECFSDLEANGVDIFGGWEGADDSVDALDTADPIVIARYWLIRWVNNLAAVRQQPASQWHPGVLLYHDALFASHKATNTALSLMREAMALPLPCSNVIQKVVATLSSWLLQYEIPPFVASNEVPVETSSLLLINMLLSFFQSPYLLQPGDRLQSAITTSYSILRACRDIASHRHSLPRPLSVRVWSELMYRLCQSAARICSHSDKYSQEMSSAFAITVLSNIVMIKAVRLIDIDDKLWDEVNNVFVHGIWIQMAQQWSRISNSVTRAMILHLAHVDIFTQEDFDKLNQGSTSGKRNDVIPENDGGEENSVDTESSGDNSSFLEGDDITSAVQTWNGNPTIWLQVWRRVMCIFGPHCVSSANALIAVETLSNTINNLLSANLDPLAHWIASRLVQTPVNLLPNCIASLGTILNCSKQPSPILQAHILHAFIRLISARDSQVLLHISSMSPRHLSVLSHHLLQAVPTLITQYPPNTHTLKVLALLSTSNAPAEQLLIKQLSPSDISLTHALLCVNALCMLIIQRGDSELLAKMFSLLQSHRCGPNLLPVLCSCLESLFKVSKNPAALQVILRTIPTLRDDRLRTEVQWTIASLALAHSLKSDLPQITKTFLADKQRLLEGALVTMEGQFPLPGFNVSKWNSVESTPSKPNEAQVFIQRNSAIIGVNKDQQLEVTSRTVVGRHCWVLEPHKSERKECRNVNNWLQKEAQRARRSGRESVGILGAMDDPFDSLPRPNNATPNKCSPEWMNIVESSRRQPQPLKPMPPSNGKPTISRLHEWRSFSASLGFVPNVADVPSNFSRDLKHLDQTCAREVHKVAVIYVADGQEDKQAILSNSKASPNFDRFVSELGWEVCIGRGHEGYPGGLPYDTTAPYYATPDTELIFHVSTHLSGDVTQKWKHIGNDEVHVVWSENSKPYRRETIATKFCDVLIVLERADEKMYRVRVETVSALEFGPLYDGALVGGEELAELVRLTVINASRAYRLAHKDHIRPLRHREHVFAHDTMRHMKKVRLSDAINALYIPTMTA